MKTKNKAFFLLLCILLFFGISCKDKSKQLAESEAEKKERRKMDSLLQQPIRYPENEIKLSEAAQNEAEEWMLYVAMESEIKRMKDYTLDDVVSNASSILRASDTLMQTIPKKFRNKPIESRVKVLHTKVSVMEQLSRKQEKDLDKLKEVAEEVPVDFFNLNIQLNEVYIEMPDLESFEK